MWKTNKYLYLFICLPLVFFTRSSQAMKQNVIQTPEPGTVETDRYGFEMVYVPAGSFEMGITYQHFHDFIMSGGLGDVLDSQIGFLEDITAEQGVFETYTATVDGFWIDRYEVTIEQYRSRTSFCMGTGQCSRIDLSSTPELASDPNQPQVKVSWFDAMLFCNGRGARLPSEEDWEYAASGPDNRHFPWGDVLISDYLSTDSTYPVGSRAENVSWIGAYDMAGNAEVWVEDRLMRYLPLSQTQTPVFIIESDVQRVIRGGSYLTLANSLTTFGRRSENPITQGIIGIRCARSSDPHLP